MIQTILAQSSRITSSTSSSTGSSHSRTMCWIITVATRLVAIVPILANVTIWEKRNTINCKKISLSMWLFYRIYKCALFNIQKITLQIININSDVRSMHKRPRYPAAHPVRHVPLTWLHSAGSMHWPHVS